MNESKYDVSPAAARYAAFIHVIDDPKAPERLRGKEVKALLSQERLSFVIDMPDDPTGQEIGYFKWFVGEMMDQMKLNPNLERIIGQCRHHYDLTEEEKHVLESLG